MTDSLNPVSPMVACRSTPNRTGQVVRCSGEPRSEARSSGSLGCCESLRGGDVPQGRAGRQIIGVPCEEESTVMAVELSRRHALNEPMRTSGVEFRLRHSAGIAVVPVPPRASARETPHDHGGGGPRRDRRSEPREVPPRPRGGALAGAARQSSVAVGAAGPIGSCDEGARRWPISMPWSWGPAFPVST